MIDRGIYTDLLDHLEKKQITVLTGMRRVGKATLSSSHPPVFRLGGS